MKRLLILKIATFVSIAWYLASCEKPEVVEDAQMIQYLNTNSVDTLKIQAGNFILETYLNRDFMPGGPIPKKRLLTAVVYLVNTDSLAIPENLDISRLYVINYPLVWISEPGNGTQSYLPDYKLKKVSNDGPEWETGIYVDVVAEVVNYSNAEKFLLIARHQYIERTEK